MDKFRVTITVGAQGTNYFTDSDEADGEAFRIAERIREAVDAIVAEEATLDWAKVDYETEELV